MRSWALRALSALVVLGLAAALVVVPKLARPADRQIPVTPITAPETAPWTPPQLATGWRAAPPKTRPMGAVAEQGGLWRLDVPYDGGGQLRTVPGEVPAPDDDAAPVATVRVEVEVGLGVDGAEFARQVMATLNDPRGWGHDGSVSFARTAGDADIDVTLASPATTDRLCAPVDTGGTVSCGRVGFAVLNAVRWAQGADPFLAAGGTVEEYRYYLVNHEVGHVLGQPHVRCPAPGATAPVMLQQTLGLGGCLPNGWPASTS